MKVFIVFLSCLMMMSSGFAQEATPQELITRLIEAAHNSAYNPINNSPEELLKADAINAELRLKQLLLVSTNEELRICYALRIVNQSIGTIEQMIRNKTPTSMNLTTALAGPLRQREILVKYLREIRKQNAEQSAAPNAAPPHR